MSFSQKIKSVKFKIASFITSLTILIGGYFTQLQTCTQNAIITTTQVAQNPSNQLIAMEATSFVANLFYEGVDDPFQPQ